MCRNIDSRGRFVGRGRSLIPTSPLTSPPFQESTQPTQTQIPFIGWKTLPEIEIS